MKKIILIFTLLLLALPFVHADTLSDLRKNIIFNMNFTNITHDGSNNNNEGVREGTDNLFNNTACLSSDANCLWQPDGNGGRVSFTSFIGSQSILQNPASNNLTISIWLHDIPATGELE